MLHDGRLLTRRLDSVRDIRRRRDRVLVTRRRRLIKAARRTNKQTLNGAVRRRSEFAGECGPAVARPSGANETAIKAVGPHRSKVTAVMDAVIDEFTTPLWRSKALGLHGPGPFPVASHRLSVDSRSRLPATLATGARPKPGKNPAKSAHTNGPNEKNNPPSVPSREASVCAAAQRQKMTQFTVLFLFYHWVGSVGRKKKPVKPRRICKFPFHLPAILLKCRFSATYLTLTCPLTQLLA